MATKFARFAAVTIAALTIACGDGDSTGPGGFNSRDYVGLWEVRIEQHDECWSPTTLRFTVDEDDVTDHPEIMNFVSLFWFDTSPDNKRPIAGNFDAGRDRVRFVAVRAGGQARGEFSGGPITPSGPIQGTFTDLGTWHMTFYGGPCSAPASLRRIGG